MQILYSTFDHDGILVHSTLHSYAIDSCKWQNSLRMNGFEGPSGTPLKQKQRVTLVVVQLVVVVNYDPQRAITGAKGLRRRGGNCSVHVTDTIEYREHIS
jgi:hypothetical protein